MNAIDAETLSTVVAPGAIVAGMSPAAIILQDVSADTLVLDVATKHRTNLGR